MTLRDIYDMALDMGIAADPRGAAGVKRYLAHRKKAHAALSVSARKYYDQESLTNPYSDTRILIGDESKTVKRLLAGIDIDGSEVLLADRLTERGTPVDLVITHHPLGAALTALHEVMDIQVDMFEQAGVPANVAHGLFDTRKEAVQRRFSPTNHSQVIDMARLLDVPLMAIHTVWDNLGHKFIVDHIGDRSYYSVDELVERLLEIPEYADAAARQSGPLIVSGSGTRRTGRIIVGFTGGTNPSKELYLELARAGVGTIVEMHIPEDVVQELRKLHINVIDTGHMASDSIGANIFLDKVQAQGVEIITCSGLTRVTRTT